MAIGDHILRHQLTGYLPQEFESTVIYHVESDWDKLLKALIDRESYRITEGPKSRAFSARALVANTNWGNNWNSWKNDRFDLIGQGIRIWVATLNCLIVTC